MNTKSDDRTDLHIKHANPSRFVLRNVHVSHFHPSSLGAAAEEKEEQQEEFCF